MGITIIRVSWGNDLAHGIKRCMVAYGYGYEYVVHVEPVDGCALLADEYVQLTSEEIQEIHNYFNGTSYGNIIHTAQGKVLICKE